MASDTKLVEVTQADRDAAAAYVDRSYPRSGKRLGAQTRDGAAFWKLSEAFAHHRIASTHPTSDNRSEMVERLQFALDHLIDEPDAIDAVRSAIAALSSLRTLEDGGGESG
jgi:hypothetical protein